MNLTIIIVIITVVASFLAWNKYELYEKWMMIPYRVKHYKEYYRFLTSGFIHSGYMHLGFNMLAFYSFGLLVEYKLGPILFLILYLGGIIISDIPTYFKFRNYEQYRSLGASGGVSAVIFSSILFHPLMEMGLLFIPIRISGFIFGIAYLIYSYFQAKKSSDNINHDAHFYGAVFGLLFTAAIDPDIVPAFFYQLSHWRMF